MSAFGVLAYASVALVAFAPRAHGQFEGTITMHMNSARGGQDMLWALKNDRGRMDMTAAGGSMFVLRQGDKTTIVMPAQKMYMEQVIPVNVATNGQTAKVKASDVEFTGKKDMIAGYECEHVITSDEANGSKYDVCLAKGLGTFMMPSNPMGRGRDDNGPMSAIMKKLDGAVFPLRVQKVGSATPELEVTKIEKKSLDDSMFEVPSGFRKFDMGALMGRPPVE